MLLTALVLLALRLLGPDSSASLKASAGNDNPATSSRLFSKFVKDQCWKKVRPPVIMPGAPSFCCSRLLFQAATRPDGAAMRSATSSATVCEDVMVVCATSTITLFLTRRVASPSSITAKFCSSVSTGSRGTKTMTRRDFTHTAAKRLLQNANSTLSKWRCMAMFATKTEASSADAKASWNSSRQSIFILRRPVSGRHATRTSTIIATNKQESLMRLGD